VVVPTVPAIVEAIKQGRSATLVPLGVGEYEPTSVKRCKLVIESTNDTLHSLQANFDKSTDLLRSQQAILQDTINKRSEFLQLSSEKIQAMNYRSDYTLSQLNNNVVFQQNAKSEIVASLQKRVETAIDYLNRIRDYCLNLDRP